MKTKVTDFFLSANTPVGFVSEFKSLCPVNSNGKCYILKGPPGCGKSGILKKIAEKASQKYENVERIHCSCDSDSLDGVIVKDLNISFVDGTLPHCVEPLCPVSQHMVVSLYDGCNADLLNQNREKISALVLKKQALSEKCRRLLMSTEEFYRDNYSIAENFTDIAKIYAQTHRIIKNEFKPVRPYAGAEEKRFFSVLTGNGVSFFPETIKALADKVYLLQDEYGVFSDIMLSAVRNHALYCGYRIISCRCSAASCEKLEHIFIPELSLAFVCSNKYHDLDLTPYRIINSRRYTSTSLLRENRRHLSFNKRSVAQILQKSTDIMGEIHSVHNEIEKIYGSAMDYSKTDEAAEKLLQTI